MSPSDSRDDLGQAVQLPQLGGATPHRRGSLTLPRSPCVHAAPTAPDGDVGINGRLLTHHPAAFPFWQEGRLQRDTFEAFSGFTHIAACTLASPAWPDISGGFSRAVTHVDCSVSYRGVSTTPRTGPSPAGDRDPGGLMGWLFSVHLNSFRDALPAFCCFWHGRIHKNAKSNLLDSEGLVNISI